MPHPSRTRPPTTLPASGVDAPWPPEWWERWAERRAAWARRHAVWVRRLLVARLVLLAVSVVWLVVASLLLVDVRRSMVAVYVGSAWVCVLWFLMLRTKTVTLAGMLKWFAGSVLWSLAIGWLLYRYSRTPDMFPSFTGPMTMIASFGEESLKLLPLAVLAAVAPGRVRRFSAADWTLLGVTSGAGFLCAEEILKRIAAREQWGDALFIVSNLTTFGPGGSAQPEQDVFFPGHHVTTGLITCSVGLAVALWRWAGRRDVPPRIICRGAAVLVVVTTWWSAVSVHAHVNLRSEDVDLLPWPVRTCVALLPDSWGGTWTLVLAVATVLAVDGHRLRTAGGWAFPLPVRGPFAAADQALGRIAVPTSAPVVVRTVSDLVVSAVRAWWFMLADTLRGFTTSVAAGARQPGEKWWHATRAAQASVVMMRRSREWLLAEPAPPARPAPGRIVGIGGAAILLAAAFPISRALAERVETTRDRSLGITWWLAGLLDRLGAWWGDLSGWEKAVVIGAALALTFAAATIFAGATVGGALLWGVSGASAAHAVVDNTDTLADIARDPSTAAENYWRNATPASVALDVGTLALTFWAPSRLAAPVRRTMDGFFGTRSTRSAIRRTGSSGDETTAPPISESPPVSRQGVAAAGQTPIKAAPGDSPADDAARSTDGLEGVLSHSDLNPAQFSNLTRYAKKLPAGAEPPIITRGANGTVRLSSTVPGKVPGSYATYDKVVDASGTTVAYTKTTVAPDGTIVHIKDKLPS